MKTVGKRPLKTKKQSKAVKNEEAIKQIPCFFLNSYSAVGK
jgi:hypothetical protein